MHSPAFPPASYSSLSPKQKCYCYNYNCTSLRWPRHSVTCVQLFPDVAALTPQASIVYICRSVNKYVQQEQPGLADGSREPLISSAGLLVTRLVNALTKMNQHETPSPRPQPPDREPFLPPQRIRDDRKTGLTAGFHCRHEPHINVAHARLRSVRVGAAARWRV